MVKLIYSEKATNFSKISTADSSYVITVKSTVEMSQNFMAFSEYMIICLNRYEKHQTTSISNWEVNICSVVDGTTRWIPKQNYFATRVANFLHSVVIMQIMKHEPAAQ